MTPVAASADSRGGDRVALSASNSHFLRKSNSEPRYRVEDRDKSGPRDQICSHLAEVEPVLLAGREWAGRPGGEAAELLLAEARKGSTTKKYARVLAKWQKFCEEGYLGQAYDPLKFSHAKWWLFAGWMMDPAHNNDKDLNVVRSAINRYMEDHGRGRPALGFTVAQVIKTFKFAKERQKRDNGEDVALNRQPCPEQAFTELLSLGEKATGLQLRQIACQVVQLLCWFRADTVAGLRSTDVWFDSAGHLNVLVRHVKMRPEFRLNPAQIRIPPGSSYGHVRSRVFRVLRRAFELAAGWPSYVADQVVATRENGAAAAKLMTAELRRLVGAVVQLPDGAIIASHSWREMAAVASARAGFCMFRMSNRGLWRRIETMLQSYIRPFEHFPFSAVLAELYDDLAASAPAVQVLRG
jgi:hypothetical protein